MTRPTPSKKKSAVSPQASTLQLLRDEAAQDITTPIYFHKPNELFGWLGQWYIPTPPMRDLDTDLTFNCCEQYMMYHKAMTFNDQHSVDAVMRTSDPREQKSLGKKVRGFKDHEWDKSKYDVVVQGNYLKFTQCTAPSDDGFIYPPPPLVNGRPIRRVSGHGKQGEKTSVGLRDLLLATGGRELVEAAPNDTVWGVGFSAEKAEELRLMDDGVGMTQWGKNLLGRALMEVRERIRAEDQTGRLSETVREEGDQAVDPGTVGQE